MWGNPMLFHLGKPIEKKFRKDKCRQRLLKKKLRKVKY